jgi:hypothetical protein
MTRDVYHNLLSEKMEAYRIDDYFNFVRKISIWSYIIAPLLLWIKITFYTLLIQFPLVLKFIDIPFKKLFRIVSFAQIPVLISGFIKIIWLFQYKPYQITEKTLALTPLALTNLINSSLYPKTTIILLSNINVFEMIWCIIVVKGLAATEKIKKIDAFLLVLGVWSLILVLQWALLMYFTKVNS